MTEISDTLRDNAGLLWNISVNSYGEIIIQNPDAPADEWTDATYSIGSWTDQTYTTDSWEDYSY